MGVKLCTLLVDGNEFKICTVVNRMTIVLLLQVFHPGQVLLVIMECAALGPQSIATAQVDSWPSCFSKSAERKYC